MLFLMLVSSALARLGLPSELDRGSTLKQRGQLRSESQAAARGKPNATYYQPLEHEESAEVDRHGELTAFFKVICNFFWESSVSDSLPGTYTQWPGEFCGDLRVHQVKNWLGG